MSILGPSKGREGPRHAELPLVYASDTVVIPRTLSPLLAATKFCQAAVEEALKGDKRVVAAMLKRIPDDKEPEIEVRGVGTIARIVQQVRLPDGSSRLIVEGEARARIKKTKYRGEYLSASVEEIDEAWEPGPEIDAAMRLSKRSFVQFAELSKKVPAETVSAAERCDDPHRLCEILSAAFPMKAERKQAVLEAEGAKERLEALEISLEGEIEIIALQKRINSRVKGRMDKAQKEYYLQEQLKEINRELGKEGEEPESKELERALLVKGPSEEAMAKARKELGRLAKMQSLSPEAGVLRSYVEWLIDLPWSPRAGTPPAIEEAKAILDRRHYGMVDAKERILELIAVRTLAPMAKGPILCLMGPPGTGKTSLGRSIAEALGRDFVRVSLGGVRDEAEIRGHRKTYVGALPGKIIQSMRKAGSTNPVFVLDEIDKMSSDFRGDPASALLEVLDPEQNDSFQDHYLELPYDLSGVVFVATANSLSGIPLPLLDRMELIETPGYSEYEKLEIARSFIAPRQLGENGLGGRGVSLRDGAILEIIRHYTAESGVRGLEREIARLARRIARKSVEKSRDGGKPIVVREKDVARFLGKRKREGESAFKEPKPGLAFGLAWTEFGGAILPVETVVFQGDKDLILTGNLGEVMKESARTALSFVRSRASVFGLDASAFEGKTIHVHVPAGAVPKDGPSAGVALAASIVSALLGRPLAPAFAMTGEISLTGRVLPVGGVKEKMLAACREKMATVILPSQNEKDLDDLPREVRSALSFSFVEKAEDALALLLPSDSE